MITLEFLRKHREFSMGKKVNALRLINGVIEFEYYGTTYRVDSYGKVDRRTTIKKYSEDPSWFFSHNQVLKIFVISKAKDEVDIEKLIYEIEKYLVYNCVTFSF
jgi:hypothetical protein